MQRGYTNKDLIRADGGLNKANPPPLHPFVFVDEAGRGLERDLRLGPLKGSECTAAAASDCDGAFAFAADSFPSDIARLQEREEREGGRSLRRHISSASAADCCRLSVTSWPGIKH